MADHIIADAGPARRVRSGRLSESRQTSVLLTEATGPKATKRPAMN
jgi:hypothetical protein